MQHSHNLSKTFQINGDLLIGETLNGKQKTRTSIRLEVKNILDFLKIANSVDIDAYDGYSPVWLEEVHIGNDIEVRSIMVRNRGGRK